MNPPRYQTGTTLNNKHLDKCVGGLFYSLDTAIEAIDSLVNRKICRTGFVVDNVTGETLHTASMGADEPYHDIPDYY